MSRPLYPIKIAGSRICWILLCCVMAIQLSAQTFSTTTINSKAGLATDHVLQTVTSKAGLLFAATQKGLVRYDGYHFFKYAAAASNTTSIATKNNAIFYTDAIKGLCYISEYVDTPTIVSAMQYTDATPDNDHYESIFIDKENRIWCNDFTQVKYFTPNFTDSAKYVIDPDGKGSRKTCYLETALNGLWIGTNTGLFVWDAKTKQLHPHTDTSINQLDYAAIVEIDKHNALLLTRQAELIFYSFTTHEVTRRIHLPEAHRGLIDAIRYDSQHIVYCNNNQVHCYDIFTGKQLLLYNNASASISHLNYDANTHTIWVSSNKGIIKLKRDRDAIRLLSFTQDTVNAGKPVLSIVEDNNDVLWMTTGNALYSYARSKGWQQYKVPENTELNNLLWYKQQLYATSNKGVFVWTGSNWVQQPIAKGEGVKKIVFDNDDNSWLLMTNSLVKVYNSKGLLQKNFAINNDSSFWKENLWNDIIFTSSGGIAMAGWMPKSYGIAFYSKEQLKFVEASQMPANSDHNLFIGDYFNKVSIGKNNHLLFTGYGGFNSTDSSGKLILKINGSQYDLSDEDVEGISQADDGKIWFASSAGLFVLDTTGKNYHIGQTAGLPAEELIYGYCQLRNGHLAIGTINGFIEINTRKVLVPEFANNLRLSSFEVNGISIPSAGNVFTLSFNQNSVRLLFSSLSYAADDQQLYRYKITGDSSWTITENPEIMLSHIAPGSYDIVIQTGDRMGNWQSQHLQLHIHVKPPYYQTIWFRLLLILLLGLIVYAAYRYKLAQQRASYTMQRKLKEAQMQALRTQMNPHFIFNSLNSINSFILDKRTEEASEYLTTFSKLMRTTLDLTRKDTIRLSQEMEALRLYLEIESARLEMGFDYRFNISPELDMESIQVPPLILQPFVENAIWHGLRNKQTAGNIVVSLRMTDASELHVCIEDDGIGRKKASLLKKNFNEHKSYGMEITANRLALHHPDNKVIVEDVERNGVAAGTSIHLYIHVE